MSSRQDRSGRPDGGARQVERTAKSPREWAALALPMCWARRPASGENEVPDRGIRPPDRTRLGTLLINGGAATIHSFWSLIPAVIHSRGWPRFRYGTRGQIGVAADFFLRKLGIQEPTEMADEPGSQFLPANMDQSVLGSLLLDLQPWLEARARRMVERRLNGRVTASELVQETFKSAVRAFPGCTAVTLEDFRKWIARIQINNFRDALRNHRRPQRDVRREVPFPADGAADQRRPVPATASQVVMALEETERLERAVAALPMELALLVKLRFKDQHTFREIAVQMDIPESTVRHRISEAIVLLKALLE